jgi:NAD(P)-dependent dehydrogenase (short-subunit alcohol dehydrogenase family)
VSVDLIDFSALETALDRVTRDIGPFDLLVNNHGSFRAYGPVREVDPVEWRADIEINLHGSFHTCRVLAPRMLALGKGRIVNLVGGGTGGSFPHGSGYAASKAGLMRFTECLNDTTLAGGVRAFALDPGLVRTAMTELQLHSAAGQAWLPGINALFDEGVNVPPSRAASVVAAIAEGRFDALAGRMLRGVDELADLELQIPRILAEDLRSLRLTGIDLPKL